MAQYRVIVNTVTNKLVAVISVENQDSITYLPTNEGGEDLESYVVTNLRKLLAKLSGDSALDLTELEEQAEQEAFKSNQITEHETPFEFVVSLPHNFDNTRTYPIVFHFHGANRNNLNDIIDNELMLFLQGRSVQSIVFAPLLSTNPTTYNAFVEWVINDSEWSDNIDMSRINALGEGHGADAILKFMENANDGGLTRHWQSFNTITLVNADIRSAANGKPRYTQVFNNNVMIWLIGTAADANFSDAEIWHDNYLTANPTARVRITKYTDATIEQIKHIPYRNNTAIRQGAQTTQLRDCFIFNRSIENYWNFIRLNPKP